MKEDHSVQCQFIDYLKGGDLCFDTDHRLADLSFYAALLPSAIEFIKESWWLKNQDKNSRENFPQFLSSLFTEELSSLDFLRESGIFDHEKGMTGLVQRARQLEEEIINKILASDSEKQRMFLTESLNRLLPLFLQEEEFQKDRAQELGHKGMRLYRTFDQLDQVLRLDYGLDQGMPVDQNCGERLYEGAGVGVQSGYSTILLTLHFLNIKTGAKVIDLGSGYGRVGLVTTLIRPDINFIGYEYVPHRVEVSNQAAERLGLASKLQFFTQDLSQPNFDIPDADVYYLYDPFSKETYGSVLDQLVAIGRNKPISIVTKGNASQWLLEVAHDQDWPLPITYDYGNLCLFQNSLT